MKKRVIKLIVCIMLISALMVGFCTAFASAATPVWLLRAKAGIAAAMLASNLIINPVNAALDETLLEGIDPIGYVEQIQDTPWTEYIDRSTIVVRPDVAIIDGVSYSDIWLGPDATENLRLTGLDFASVYNILTNQSEAITYANGIGSVSGIPIYYANNAYRSQRYHLYVSGDASASYGDSPYNLNIWTRYNPNVTAAYQFGADVGTDVPSYKLADRNPFDGAVALGNTRFQSTGWDLHFYQNGTYQSSSTGKRFGDVVSSPFSFDYTSGDIYLEPDPEDGLLLRVPSSYDDGQTGSVFNYDIHDLINIYPQVDDTYGHDLVFDPSLNPDFDIDLDMGNALGDIITAVILAKLADLLGNDSEVIYAPMPEKDEPIEPGIIDPLPDPDPAPDEPSPGTTIANTDWTKLDEILRWIQSTIDSIRHLTESLQTMLDSIFDAIQSVIQHISEIPEAIRELADKILEDIELGPSKLFDKALDILKTLFLPLLLPIRAMMNLWHYVVEWIQSISSPFTWIFGIMSSTSANMVLPIYALLAGGICISIYKALGR